MANTSDRIQYKGITFYRYPNAKQRAHRVYYLPHISNRRKGYSYYHVELWKDAYGDTRTWQVELWKLSTGEDLDELYPKSAFYKMRSEDPLRFWPSITYAMRKAVAEVRSYEISDEEIIAAPVGEVPPSKTD